VAIILISDPHPAVVELIAEVVRRLGHDPVDVASSPALPSVDAMVLEPDDAGALSWARMLRSVSPSLPLIFVTNREVSAEALELGPVTVLRKPVPLEELADAVAAAVGPR
jgi:CheY-like chemotaxis protein